MNAWRNPNALRLMSKRRSLRANAERMGRSLEPVVADVVRLWHERFPSFGALRDDAFLADVHASVAQYARAYVACIAAGRRLNPVEVDALQAHGRRLVARGVHENDIVGAYRLGTAVLLEHFCAALEVTCPAPTYRRALAQAAMLRTLRLLRQLNRATVPPGWRAPAHAEFAQVAQSLPSAIEGR